MRRVFSADNTLMAGHVKSLLEMRGISCVIRNQLLGGGIGELAPIDCWPEVWVTDDADYGQAMAVVDDALRPADDAAPWRCRCGEEIEGQFTACWNCGRDRDAKTT